MNVARRALKNQLGRLGWHGKARGFSALRDLQRSLPRQRYPVLFDVGANIGDVTAAFVRLFSDAHIFAFEPGESASLRLSKRFGKHPRVTVERIALGATPGQGAMSKSGASTEARLLIGEALANPVTIETVSEYAKAHGIGRISFLKVDTEGFDVEVLRGALDLLENQRIDILQCECGIDPENTLHRPLWEVVSLLEPLGYRIFGFYDQTPEWIKGLPHLRRVDAVFISAKVIRDHAGATVGVAGKLDRDNTDS